ncbi:ATPase family AAA domain-containing protein 5 [Diplogelasinospora grovesii]|uniref:ATPase family AAA domain-containing protein 5 n=1 Tax=Diplogelasinospora grovesii TaxID=303347 RepID=A0AAN6NEJ4_9PEZI|nr:ATPase family AAA domain-containing protein 5 [Diplogelasinospora grovesii]
MGFESRQQCLSRNIVQNGISQAWAFDLVKLLPMGSVAVLTMAEDANPRGCTESRPLHPFFTPSRSPARPAEDCVPDDTNVPTPASALAPLLDSAGEGISAHDVSEQSGGRRSKRRKVNANREDDGRQRTRAKRHAKSTGILDITKHFTKPGTCDGVATDNDHHVGGPGVGPSNQGGQLIPDAQHEERHQEDLPEKHPRDESSQDKQCQENQISESLFQPPTSTLNAEIARPRKVLQLNPKTGTIGSPPKPKPPKTAKGKTGEDGKKDSPRRGKRMSRVVCINYGIDSESRMRIGCKINSILNARVPESPAKSEGMGDSGSQNNPPLEVTKPAASQPPSKETHPFFQTKKSATIDEVKIRKAPPSPPPARPKTFSSTPCSPTRPRLTASNVRAPQFGIKTTGRKFPGSKTAAWPWKDMVHVRGDGLPPVDTESFSSLPPPRKSKGHAVKVSKHESLMEHVTRSMEIPVMAECVRNINTDNFVPPPPELRLPRKHFESGRKLQARILPELRSFRISSSLSRTTSQCKSGSEADLVQGIQPPMQLSRLFNSICSSLSAFDRSQCESANWAQKYAPTSAVEVLQTGQEASLLRDWLRALMVQSVDTGAPENDKSKAGPGKIKGSGGGKARKKRKKLDGFIVSSDDEGYELSELSDCEEDWNPSGSRGIMRKTVVRSANLSRGKEGLRLNNTLVISGAHGCGKTAAVYAVAKELDFEVFEINSSSRRSGKDVLEKIGDMTRNHLVQQQHQANGPAEGGEATGVEDEVAADLKSGKQSTMSSFFKPKTAAAAKPKNAPKVAASGQQKETKSDAPKTQRQSLILLEEVDMLYEEDRQFWATVIGLVAQSKRPFIMTCNDETLLPLQNLSLHGIFRLGPPPTDLAVDRLLLVAANEGHALTRQAVEALYEARKRDLRAATMDMQYWCQIGVGDRRGGFDWFYPRWPKGIDLDENSEVIRVVSQDTYHAGMNWLARDSLVDPKMSSRLVEEELLCQTWESWGLDIGNWQDSVGLASWAESMSTVATAPADRLAVLEAYDDIAEAMSMADTCSCRAFAKFQEQPLDATLPNPPAKMRDDFVLGFTHLDTPVTTQYSSLTTSVPSTIKSLAKSSLQSRTEALRKTPASDLDPLNEARVLEWMRATFASPPPGTPAISRIDFAFAFDPLAAAESLPMLPVSYLDPSVFDRTLELIVLDVAPWVRGIVAYDSRLQKQRLRLSSLVSEGGRGTQGAKRMRTTRAALSALEGGSRSSTRGERWFKADINPHLIMKTAGKDWGGPDHEETEEATGPLKRSRKKAVLKDRERKKRVVEEEDSADELVDDDGGLLACTATDTQGN